jgi:hypothetical protein
MALEDKVGKRPMIHGVDIKAAITFILALTGLLGALFALLNTLVKQISEFLVRLLAATEKVVKAFRKLTNDLQHSEPLAYAIAGAKPQHAEPKGSVR